MRRQPSLDELPYTSSQWVLYGLVQLLLFGPRKKGNDVVLLDLYCKSFEINPSAVQEGAG